MSIQELDFIFPFIVFGYGVIMCFVLSSERLMNLAEERLPKQILEHFKVHKALGWICLYVGGVWSLQNLWI